MRAVLCAALLAGCGSPTTGADGGGDLSAADLSAVLLPLGDMAGACDPLQASCAGALSKCEPAAATGPFVCAAPGGAKGDGDACAKTSASDDDCASGLYCLQHSLPAGMLHCRKYCKTPGDCDAGQSCGILTKTVGVCDPPCTAFGSCGAGLNCGAVAQALGGGTFLDCKAPGTAALNAVCKTDADCQADLVCLPDPKGVVETKCIALCDGAHACAAGTCSSFAGLMICR